uniref:Serine carboxypeptidase-like 13 n=1 Tax=Rhizophora mucronata TaxID=61149 RepID=A0A2P2K6R5_RHIMU
MELWRPDCRVHEDVLQPVDIRHCKGCRAHSSRIQARRMSGHVCKMDVWGAFVTSARVCFNSSLIVLRDELGIITLKKTIIKINTNKRY